MLKLFGRTNLAEFLGDRVVYRGLAPADPALPSLDGLREPLNLAVGRVPRKSEPDYARVVVEILKAAAGATLERLLFVGDTRLNDSTAFANLCAAGGWPGMACIVAETESPPAIDGGDCQPGRELYIANRWSLLPEFDRLREAGEFPVDEHTAVIFDIDKTALGARGRNAGVIDKVRVEAVRRTVAGLLGADFDPETFRRAYEVLNQQEYHFFTADNQDYLAYICLVLGTSLENLEGLLARLEQGAWRDFEAFIAEVEARREGLPPALGEIHTQIYRAVRAGDPTPFKTFRRNEYLLTVGRLGQLEDTAAVADMLAHEIVITQEVRALALDWLSQGALTFGLSDKPDEASLPTPEQAGQGYLPLHRVATHALGEAE